MYSHQYIIQEEKTIPHYEETQKRSVGQKFKKIKNTFFMLLAYACPTAKIRVRLHRWRGVNIGKNVYIGLFCFLDNLYPEYIYIEDNASINAGTMILTHFNPMKRFAPIFQAKAEPVLIKEGAIIAVKSIILPGVCIGMNAIVAAGTVVEKSVPDYTLVKGNPAQKILDYKTLME